MTLFIWAAIAIVVLVSLLLIHMEHEWGFVLGGSTAVILVVSYFSAELLLRTPLAALLPQGARSLDAKAVIAGTLGSSRSLRLRISPAAGVLRARQSRNFSAFALTARVV
jgi:hypothetical protein